MVLFRVLNNIDKLQAVIANNAVNKHQLVAIDCSNAAVQQGTRYASGQCIHCNRTIALLVVTVTQ
jgi:hypothetical protein